MKRLGWAAVPWLPLALYTTAFGSGVTPYLPLNLEPEIESQIERVLILGDKPVMTRPIAAATVLEALPKACKIDLALCHRVQRYLARYTHSAGITHGSLEGAVSSGKGADTVDPNRYGMREDSHWEASGQAYLQPSDYVLLDAGVVAYEGHTNFNGSMISLGFSFAQLDIGFRPHWFSPMTDSSLLMSTEAPTMPSVTLSNYAPLTAANLHYEFFLARMSNSNRIVFDNGLISGSPRLAGFHADIEPATGWSLGASRLLQFGGGALGGNSPRELFNAFFSPGASQSSNASKQIGNQEASITSNFLFPGRVPFAIYFEYAGEDTSRGKDYLLGNSALSAGIHFPRVAEHFDLTFEVTEWQNLWYVHTVYLDGLTNYGLVVGNWFGDQRIFGDGVGGRSGTAIVGWEPPFGGLLQLKYRTLQNASYSHENYVQFRDFSLTYSHPWKGVVLGGELDEGRDVFGGNFTRLGGFVRYDEGASGSLAMQIADETSEDSEQPLIKDGELFVDAGYNVSRENLDLTSEKTRHNGPVGEGYHFALGARRAVSDHNDLGARIEAENVQGHSLINVRAVDWRYRFNNPLAVGAFFGASRYDLGTPAYGFYYGVGVAWRNVLPGWDLGLDLKYSNSVARDLLLPTDPTPVQGRPDSFYDISTAALYISKHF